MASKKLTTSTKYINNLEVNFKIVQSEKELMQQLVTTDGFYDYWFEQLSKSENKTKTYKIIFEEVNELYKKLFKVKEGRYGSYASFAAVKSRLRKIKK